MRYIYATNMDWSSKSYERSRYFAVQIDTLQLSSQLEKRKRNLKPVSEGIEAVPSASRKLSEVRDFLIIRIKSIEERRPTRTEQLFNHFLNSRCRHWGYD
jgi:hypothetical protein